MGQRDGVKMGRLQGDPITTLPCRFTKCGWATCSQRYYLSLANPATCDHRPNHAPEVCGFQISSRRHSAIPRPKTWLTKHHCHS